MPILVSDIEMFQEMTQPSLFDVPSEIWLQCAYARAEAPYYMYDLVRHDTDPASCNGICNTLNTICAEYQCAHDGYHLMQEASGLSYPFGDSGSQDDYQEARLLFCLLMAAIYDNPNRVSYFDDDAVLHL